MMQARPRVRSMILEDRDVVHAMIGAEHLVALFIDA
jgi:hypothetical protein